MSMTKLMLGSFRVPGYGLTVANSFQIASEDLSGTSSSTATAENGIKPKEFSVSTTIRFTEADDLNALTRTAESVDGKGQRTIYTASHALLTAMGVRQVRFTSTFSAVPDSSGLQAWNVSFTLREYNSAAERMEARTAASSANAQKGAGSGIAPGALADGSSAAVTGNNTGGTDGTQGLTDTEKVLQKMDAWLGGQK